MELKRVKTKTEKEKSTRGQEEQKREDEPRKKENKRESETEKERETGDKTHRTTAVVVGNVEEIPEVLELIRWDVCCLLRRVW